MADRDQKIFQREQLKWAPETIDTKKIYVVRLYYKKEAFIYGNYGYDCIALAIAMNIRK